MSANLRAVLDIGSNTIRLLVADISSTPMTRVHYEHRIVRLGEGLQQTGTLGDAGQQRALDFFHAVAKVCQSLGIAANDIRAVATAAVRDASNGTAFTNKVKAETGISITIISGQKEATLALRGALAAIRPDIGQDMLLFDIGGGSTEFSRVKQGNIVDTISQKMGVVRLTESFLHSNPPSPQDYKQLKAQASLFLQQVHDFWGNKPNPPKHLVGTAGTVTTLAAIAQDLHPYNPDAINNFRLSRHDFDQMRDSLLAKSHAERLLIPALEAGREDVIIAGLAIIDAMFTYWNYDALVAVDSGLLEGLIQA